MKIKILDRSRNKIAEYKFSPRIKEHNLDISESIIKYNQTFINQEYLKKKVVNYNWMSKNKNN